MSTLVKSLTGVDIYDQTFSHTSSKSKHMKLHEISKSYKYVCQCMYVSTPAFQKNVLASLISTVQPDASSELTNWIDMYRCFIQSTVSHHVYVQSNRWQICLRRMILSSTMTQNMVSHSSCHTLKKYFNGRYSTPYLHLFQLQSEIGDIVLVSVSNDVFAHIVVTTVNSTE